MLDEYEHKVPIWPDQRGRLFLTCAGNRPHIAGSKRPRLPQLRRRHRRRQYPGMPSRRPSTTSPPPPASSHRRSYTARPTALPRRLASLPPPPDCRSLRPPSTAAQHGASPTPANHNPTGRRLDHHPGRPVDSPPVASPTPRHRPLLPPPNPHWQSLPQIARWKKNSRWNPPAVTDGRPSAMTPNICETNKLFNLGFV